MPDHWSPHPNSVVKFREHGDQNMGTIATDESVPRFGLDVPFALVYLRAWTTSGTGNAQMDLYQWIVLERSRRWDKHVREFPSFGTDSVNFMPFRVHPGEYPHWSWDAGDRLVPVWANPNAGTMEWFLEIGLAPTV